MGSSLFNRLKRAVCQSRAYRRLSQGQQAMQVHETVLEGLEHYLSTKSIPRKFQLSVLEGGMARKQTWRERRRHRKLSNLAVRTAAEDAEHESMEQRLLLVPRHKGWQPVSPPRLERLIANMANEYYTGSSNTTIAQVAELLHTSPQDVRIRLRGFEENLAEHTKVGAAPLAFAVQDKTYQPLERLVNDAVTAYNTQIQAYKQGDTKAVHERYSRGAASLGLDEAVYKDALREHVLACEQRYRARFAPTDISGYAQPAQHVLQRFDRSLLSDYNSFADELASLYELGTESLQDIATHVADKYGMKVSTSHLSTMARERINQQRALDGKAAIYTRKEARMTCQPLETVLAA